MLYAGLLSQAHDVGLAGVRAEILQTPAEENGRLAIVKAEVETSKGMSEVLGFGCPRRRSTRCESRERGRASAATSPRLAWPWLLKA